MRTKENKNYTVRFLITLAMASLLIFIIGKNRPEPISSQILKEKFWSDKVHSKEKFEIIFSGDSRLYRGIDPKTVSDRVDGLSVLNFGFSSGGHNKIIFDEVNNKLDFLSKTKVVVLVITPHSLTPNAQENSHFLQEMQRNESDIFNRRYINPFFNFFEPIKPMELLQFKQEQSGYFERFNKNGWVASWKIPTNQQVGIQKYAKDFENNKVKTSILKELYNQIRVWEDDGIQVFAFRIPSSIEMEKLENDLSNFDEKELIKGIENAGGEWIRIDKRFEYNSYDGSHLVKSDAIKLSEKLGDILKKRFKNL